MEYKEPYIFLFNKISDLIEELKQVQQQAEEMFLAQNEPSENADVRNADT